MKRPFLLFITVITLLVSGLLWFIESPHFAHFVKVIASRYIPGNLGLTGDFSELSIKLFPPGFAVNNPRIFVEKRNVAQLPPGSSVRAERIEFNFQPLQLFSGDIRIHEVSIINGKVELLIDEAPTKKRQSSVPSRFEIHWDELLQVKAEAVSLKNVEVNLKFLKSSQGIEFFATRLKVAQWAGHGGLGYQVALDLSRIRGSYLKTFLLPDTIDQVTGGVSLNALGLQLEAFSARIQNTEVSASGQVKGNFFDAKGLFLDGRVNLNGNLSQIAKFYPILDRKSEAPSGLVSFSGKVQGNLKKISETLQAEGEVKVKDLSYRKWTADSLEADLKWQASPSGGEFSLLKAIIKSREQARQGGQVPGGGGRIEVGAVKWAVGSSQAIKVPLKFDRVHVHWLGAPVIKQIYPLEFRLTGSTFLEFLPSTGKKSWEVRGELTTSLDQFQLDNQRYQMNKPLSAVFRIPKINLKGLVVVNSKGIYTSHLSVSLPHSSLSLNGKIDFQTGYDLQAVGNVNLGDLGEIAENAVRGEGAVTVVVKGPPERVVVDIGTDIQNAYYLNLSLGHVKGRLAWDDDPSRLIFGQVEIDKGGTLCSLNGALDLKSADAVNLDVQILRGDIHSLIEIFEYLVKPLSWFPSQLKGNVRGTLKVMGGLSFSSLQIISTLEGMNWDYYGERFRSVHLRGGYSRGKYFVDQLHALKKKGLVTGSVSFDEKKKLEWKLSAEDFALVDFEHISQLDIPVRGKLTIESHGEGREDGLDSLTEVNLGSVSVRGAPLPSSYLKLRTKSGISSLQSNLMGGQGVFEGTYDLNSKKQSYFRAELKQLDFSPFLLLLNPRSMQDRLLSGLISGEMKLNFNSSNLDKANGVLSISEYLLARADARFSLDHPVKTEITNGNFRIDDLAINGKVGQVILGLKSQLGRVEGKVSGDLDNSIVEFFTPSIVQATGISELDFSMSGTLSMPVFFGNAVVRNGAVRIFSLDSPLENIGGLLQLRQNQINVQKLSADLGGGRVSAEGQILLFSNRFPEIALKGVINKAALKIYPFQYIKLNGSINVSGSEPPYLIDGNIIADSALSKEKVLNKKKGGDDLKIFQYAPPALAQGSSGYSKFKLNVDIEAPHGIYVQNDLFRDLEAKGNLTLVNTFEAPRILGTAEVMQGKVLFKDHVFKIQSATVNFDNPAVINPVFDLNAYTDVGAIKIQLYATGRPDKIRIELTSNPAMPESEIVSLLAVGLTSADAKKLSAGDLSAVQQGEAASLVLHSLDFNRELEDKTGFQVHVDESVNKQQGNSAFRASTPGDTAAAPRIVVGRKLGDRLRLSAGSTVGVGTGRSNQVNMDYLVNKDVIFSGVYNNYGVNGSTDSITTNQTNLNQDSFGLDLKFQKRFK